MNTSALIVMVATLSAITIVTVYFFIKVLITKPKAEPDSYSENDDVPRN